MSTEQLLSEGLVLPLMEEFYSLQGEGFNTGLAAYFLRIGGCDVGCRWCDVKESWNSSLYPPVSTDEIIRHAAGSPARSVVVTGGEPLLYNLGYLCAGLKERGIKTYLETSGSQPLSGTWDWICVSPKQGSPPLEEMLGMADELKVIIHETPDFTWAEENAVKVRPGCALFLQPEWSQAKVMMPAIIEYIKKDPRWRISLQSHKYMRIP